MRSAAGVVALCLFAVLQAAETPSTSGLQPESAAASSFLQALRDRTGTPAISAAVALKGTLVFSGGVGIIDLEHRVPATGSSVYNIGSVSKAITAAAMMQLLERRTIGLEDDLRAYVPEFPDKGVRITLRHLLTHTSGIRHYRANDFPGTPDNENIAPVRNFRDGLRFFAADALLFTPGSYRFYTSYGVNLLEGVVEKATGQGFEDYLREHIWQPAGMARASFDVPERVVPGRARSYRFEKRIALNYHYNDLRYKFASGGMIASVEDLVRFGAAINGGRLMKPDTRALMFSPQSSGLQAFREGAPPEPQRRGQGMLWELRSDAAGRRVAFHCGSIKASNACIVNFIDEDLVAAVATNSWECCGWAEADRLAELFRSPGSGGPAPRRDD